jgi:plasmid stabilization system protein ParE
MIVDYTPEALADLDVMWDWNARKYGNIHADGYSEFLRRETDRLNTEHTRGRAVPTASMLLYRVIQKKKKGRGHVVIYEVDADVLVRILRYFHTAQDWQNKLREEMQQESSAPNADIE